jgi:hypothetical protein
MSLSQKLITKRYLKVAKHAHDQIRHYSGHELLENIVSRLHLVDGQRIEDWRGQPPWVLLLLLKWTLMYGSFSSLALRPVTEYSVNGLINLVHAVEHSDHLLFFRAIAYQQFIFQENITRVSIGRQAIIFGKLDKGHALRKAFLEATSIELDAWLTLSFMLMATFLVRPVRIIENSCFDTVRRDYPTEMTDMFLMAYAKTLPDIRGYLRATTKHEPGEFRERSPLFRYPLLRRRNQFLCYSPTLLVRTMGDRVYDMLRATDPNRFMDRFGPLFEAYVRRGLEYMRQPFLDEKRLIRDYGSGKVTDFALITPDSIVLIDAKGVDIGHTGMTTPLSNILGDRTRSSVVKALAQGIECSRRILSTEGQREVFLIIVTYKHLYLGNGADFVRTVGEEYLRTEGVCLQGTPIDPKNVYVLSVDEFDYMAALLRRESATLADCVRRMSQLDADPSSKKLTVMQHLLSMHRLPNIPDYINESFDQVIARCAAALEAGV